MCKKTTFVGVATGKINKKHLLGLKSADWKFFSSWSLNRCTINDVKSSQVIDKQPMVSKMISEKIT